MDEWKPKVLTEYEIGRAIHAASIIARTDKPIVEVCCQRVDSVEALTSDLLECVRLAGHADNVLVWSRPVAGNRVRYGFYREAWAVDAIDFLDRTDLADADRAWISGLLFGYRSDAIQQFIDRQGEEKPSMPGDDFSGAMRLFDQMTLDERESVLTEMLRGRSLSARVRFFEAVYRHVTRTPAALAASRPTEQADGH